MLLKNFLNVVSGDTMVNVYIHGNYIGRLTAREILLGRAINYFMLATDLRTAEVKKAYIKVEKTPALCIEL